MKKPEILFIGVIILVASYFLFSYLTRKKDFDHWDLVTSNAALVYESNSTMASWNKLVNSPLWNSLSDIDEIAVVNKNLQLIDTLSGGNGQLSRFFNNKNAIISAHVTSQESYGLTYIIPLGANGHTLFLNLLVNLDNQAKIKRSKRVYESQTIYELEIGGTKISYIVYKNSLVISSEAFLIEDVVRNITNDFKDNFVNSYPALSGNPSFASDDGNLFVNGDEIALFANSFLEVNSRMSSAISVVGSIFFDVTLSDKSMFASGFAYANQKPSIVSCFKDQQAIAFNIKALIPKNAAIIEHFATSNLNKWYANWKALNGIKGEHSNEGQKFVRFLKNEIAQITLQSVDNKHLNKLFIAEVSDVAGLYNHLNKIAEHQIKQTEDSLYVEQYAGHEIRLIDHESILEKYFKFEGFNSTYYLMYNNYLIVANSANVIRDWLVQIENESVWSKSVQMNLFFKNALSEANYTYVTNLKYSWNLHVEKMNEGMKKWVTSNAQPLKDFNILAFQVSNLDNRFYTNLHIGYAPAPKIIAEQRVFDVSTIQLANPISIQPQVVKNHKTGERELLVQDSVANLILIGASGDVLWADSLRKNLKGNMYQIDYYKNQKLQYLLHSDSLYYLIDRNGDSVEGYPKKLDYAINKLYLIDYDRSKKYRILISDYFGNLRMYDKKGNLLEGWNPNEFGSNFSDDIFHARVRGKDRIFIPLANGKVFITNRRGEQAEGFPLDLGTNIANNFFVEVGENFEDTKFTTISEDGLIIRFSMTGKMLSRNQLFKESSQSNFSLVKEKQGKGYVFVQNDINRIAVINSEGSSLFEKDFPETANRYLQYYNFGPDKELYVIKSGSDVYLYNALGELLNTLAMTSDYPVSIVYFSNENACHIYLSNENTIEVKKIYF